MSVLRKWRFELIFLLYLFFTIKRAALIDEIKSNDKSHDAFSTFSPSPTSSAAEIVHMDLIPNGTLPDSVYRQLAWYGILQAQPLPASTKNRMIAKLIWQNTLGRPHVLLKSNQGYQSPNVEKRKVISEKGVSWARSQESKKQVILEAMRRGGNGITLRTVVGTTQVSEMMIMSGLSFQCSQGSKVMKDSFKIPEKRTVIGSCSSPTGTVSDAVREVDPCLEAEYTDVEYSFGEGWVYCMGRGDRDKQRGNDGKIDCGAKTKVPYSEVLDKCAVDRNVIIKFEYFGDIPRKELLEEQSICLTWSPCTLRYSYRLEPLPKIPELFPAESCCPEETPCNGCMPTMAAESGVMIQASDANERFDSVNQIGTTVKIDPPTISTR